MAQRRPPTTYRVVRIPHDSHTMSDMTLQGHPRSMIFMSFKANMRLLISDQQQPKLHVAPFRHNTSVTNDDGRTDGQTDKQTDDNHTTSSIVT